MRIGTKTHFIRFEKTDKYGWVLIHCRRLDLRNKNIYEAGVKMNWGWRYNMYSLWPFRRVGP
jgi:hypothetical protein